MTTITTEAIPTAAATTTTTDPGQGLSRRTVRFAAAALTAVALSVGIAYGVSARGDDSPALTPAKAHTTATQSSNDQCPMLAGKPC